MGASKTPTTRKQGDYRSDAIVIYDAPNPDYPFMDLTPIATVNVPDNNPESQRNAKLIAAAPDMYLALTRAQQHLRYGLSFSIESMVQDALNEIEGALATVGLSQPVAATSEEVPA